MPCVMMLKATITKVGIVLMLVVNVLADNVVNVAAKDVSIFS